MRGRNSDPGVGGLGLECREKRLNGKYFLERKSKRLATGRGGKKK